ncbi:hypothetical protein ACJRO7_000222 [Eucalyptus globulus]|uniref:DUF4220 domain-containing protein n=1 Tax=Eucalyptus globulus TaxID=34317 RepID=A0ABD3LQG8_EUCGL
MAYTFILDLWNKWNIRGFVVLSLSLQVTLILFAPLRKKTASHPLIFLLWLAYLMADSVATFAVGLISHNQGNSSAHVAEVDGAIQAFWASFLLLHLGGPDTITAFSLEDSSLWQRHLLSLIFQVGAAVYIFVQIYPSDKSLVIPTILVFLAGFIKIVERTLALYLSSFPKLRESMLLDNKRRMVVDSSRFLEELATTMDECEYDEDEAEFAESIVIFIADFIYTKEQRKMSIKYFGKVSAVNALRVISVELNFIYEELHTKALTIRHNRSYIFRIIAFTSIVVALGLFNHLKRYGLLELNVKITHILLFGGIIIDGIALFKLVFSDWTVAGIKHTTIGSFKLDAFLYNLVSTTDYLRKPRYATCEVEPNVTYKVLDTPLIFQRWSKSISARNLISEALKESPRKICKCDELRGIAVFKNIHSFLFQMGDKIISCFLQASETIDKCCGKRSTIANAKYVSKNLFMKDLWIFIFDDVKRRSTNLVDNQSVPHRMPNDLSNILGHVDKSTIHNKILAMHIATEIWYNKDKQSRSSTTTLDPALMLRELQDLIGDATTDLNAICEKLYNGVQDGMPLREPTDRLESALKDGLLWARLLEEDSREGKWVRTSDAWLGLLQYAAVNIMGETHVQVLSKGGELITLVWLLMAHFGYFFKPEWGLYREYWEERSRINERDDRDDSDHGIASGVENEYSA